MLFLYMSMLIGVILWKYGIEWNSDLLLSRLVYLNWLMIFEMVGSVGYMMVLIVGKLKMFMLVKLGMVRWILILWEVNLKEVNVDVMVVVVMIIEVYKLMVIFVYYVDVDLMGYVKGWGLKE